MIDLSVVLYDLQYNVPKEGQHVLPKQNAMVKMITYAPGLPSMPDSSCTSCTSYLFLSPLIHLTTLVKIQSVDAGSALAPFPLPLTGGLNATGLPSRNGNCAINASLRSLRLGRTCGAIAMGCCCCLPMLRLVPGVGAVEAVEGVGSGPGDAPV